MKAPATLIILDGFAFGEKSPTNAVRNAETPNLDRLFATTPGCMLEASGLDVGLPDGQMGNSEVGHTNIGAGRVVFQDLPRISCAIQDGSFFENKAYLAAIDACKETNGSLHLMGLLSDGGVHSHIDHLFALLELSKRQDVGKVYIHAFLDGRDVSPKSGKAFVAQCINQCKATGIGTLATVMGRYYAMDRDKRWARVQKAYDAMVSGDAPLRADALEALQQSYDNGVTDEFVVPFRCTPDGQIKRGDSVIFFNFRPDRAREITRSLVDPNFLDVKRPQGHFPLHFVCTTQYDATLPNVSVAFPPRELSNILGEYCSQLGMTQLRIAETEKYAHVTFFFNGGREEPFPGEDRVLIPSPQVATYDLKPEMSAFEVTKEAISRIESGKYDLIILNFANCDMVGHTGAYQAACTAVEAVDVCAAQIVAATETAGGVCLITADHGNAEEMADKTGGPMTAHTTNPVPFHIVGADVKLRNGRLSDIAPTILDLMGYEKPPEMDGQTLIIKLKPDPKTFK